MRSELSADRIGCVLMDGGASETDVSIWGPDEDRGLDADDHAPVESLAIHAVHPDARIRVAALEALEVLARAGAANTVETLLEARDRRVRRAALQALVALPDESEEAHERIDRISRSALDAEVRDAALEFLVRRGEPHARASAVARALLDHDVTARASVEHALPGAIDDDDPNTVGALLGAMTLRAILGATLFRRNQRSATGRALSGERLREDLVGLSDPGPFRDRVRLLLDVVDRWLPFRRDDGFGDDRKGAEYVEERTAALRDAGDPTHRPLAAFLRTGRNLDRAASLCAALKESDPLMAVLLSAMVLTGETLRPTQKRAGPVSGAGRRLPLHVRLRALDPSRDRDPLASCRRRCRSLAPGSGPPALAVAMALAIDDRDRVEPLLRSLTGPAGNDAPLVLIGLLGWISWRIARSHDELRQWVIPVLTSETLELMVRLAVLDWTRPGWVDLDYTPGEDVRNRIDEQVFRPGSGATLAQRLRIVRARRQEDRDGSAEDWIRAIRSKHG